MDDGGHRHTFVTGACLWWTEDDDSSETPSSSHPLLSKHTTDAIPGESLWELGTEMASSGMLASVLCPPPGSSSKDVIVHSVIQQGEAPGLGMTAYKRMIAHP